MNAVELLDQTQKEIETRGWCRYLFYNSVTGAVCLRGAMNVAGTGSPKRGPLDSPLREAYLEAESALRDCSEARFECRNIIEVNDHHVKSVQGVYDLLDCAKERLQ